MLEIRNLCVRRRRKEILDGVSLTLVPHKLTALLGKNGCGKSTLVSCINQTMPYTGEIRFSNRDLALMPPKERACLLSFLPQTLPCPHITVLELVTMGRSPYVDIGRRLTPQDKEAVWSAVCAIGIEGFSDRYLDELSGGERQKAYLAMTLAQDTRVMIMDEPTTYMDMEYEHTFLGLLNRLKQQRKKTSAVPGCFPHPPAVYLTGQRPAYTPPGAEAGGVAQSSIPRPPAHVRYAGTSEWGGH